jgi:glycosyltransferase involved in cell wall biosynthesis
MTSLLLTVGIVCRNRPSELAIALESVLAQNYPSFEVLVFDDASDRPLADGMAAAFSEVQFFDTAAQIGPTGGRAFLLRQARGSVFVSIDDDVYFTSTNALSDIAEEFQRFETLGALALPLVEPLRTPGGSRGFCAEELAKHGGRLQNFLGGSAALRCDAVTKAGGIRLAFQFFGGEERDLAIRMFECGFEIRYASTPPLVHTVSPIREYKFRYHWDVRSALLFDIFNVPTPEVYFYILVHVVRLITYKLRPSNALMRLKAVVHGLHACLKYLPARDPVRRKTFDQFKRLPRHGIEACKRERIPSPVRRGTVPGYGFRANVSRSLGSGS